MFIISSDGKEYSFTEKEISLSTFLKEIYTTMIDEPFPKRIGLSLSSTVLDCIYTYLKYKKGIDRYVSRPLKQTFRDSCNDHWDYEFIQFLVKEKHLHDVYFVADYLQMDILLHLISAYLAKQLQKIN